MLRVAVVGAGPAGSAAAFHLAMAGCEVTLIDRAAFPRDKVCGDWITPLALAELARMGLDRTTLAAAAPGHTDVRGGALGAPRGGVSRCALDPAGACVPRRTLDEAVRARALAAGCRAELRAVREPADEPGLRAYDILVDARGANVGIPNAIGLRAYWTLPRGALDEDAMRTVTLQTDADYPRGYGWWFPVGCDAGHVRLNVGVGLLAADSRPGRHVTDFFAHLETTHPVLRRLAAAAVARTRPVGYHVGLARWRERVENDRVLRIGDAANLSDPLTGDGIGNALRSGALVAAAIVASRSAAEAGSRWQATYARELAPDLRIALLLRRLLYPNRAKDLAAVLLARHEGMRRRVHGALFGATSYRALVRFR